MKLDKKNPLQQISFLTFVMFCFMFCFIACSENGFEGSINTLSSTSNSEDTTGLKNNLENPNVHPTNDGMGQNNHERYFSGYIDYITFSEI